MSDKRYREAMAEIIGVLKKYDMGGAITVVDKERTMFRYHFPTWTCIILGEDNIRVRSKASDYPNKQAERETCTLSAHCLMSMRDSAINTVGVMEKIAEVLKDKWGMEHHPFTGFDPERSH